MKRIAFIAASTAVLVQSTKTDMKILQNMGVEIHLLCPTHHRSISEEAISQFNEIYPKCIWHDVPFVNSISAFQKNKSATQTLKKKLSEIQPDVIHCFGTVANYYTKKALATLQVSASCKTFYYTPCDFPLYQGASLPRRLFYRHIEKRYHDSQYCSPRLRNGCRLSSR